MKKIIKTICLCLSTMLLAASFGACGPKKKVEDNAQTLNIYALQAGYDVKFLDEYAKMFETQNPGVTVNWKASTEAYSKIYEDLRLGPERNVYDLYLAPDAGWQISIENDHILGYDCILEDLTSLYDTKIPGEEVTIREKLYDGYEDFSYYKGKQYIIPWAGGPSGIVYNAELMSEKDVPRTTDQLMKAVAKTYGTYEDKGKEEKIYGFMTSEKGCGYFEYLGDTWWAQYEGIDNYLEFYTLGNDPKNPKGGQLVDTHFDDYGFRRNFELIEELLNSAKMYPNCIGLDHTQAQMYFLEGKAAMMPCGNWLQAEMNENFNEDEMNFKMMKTPVISDLVDVPQLKFPEGTREEKDALLSAVIDYIDNGEKPEERPEGANDIMIGVIRNARNIIYDCGISHPIFIPSYSNAKDLAKKFILMMATDEAIKKYVELVHTTTAYRYDYKSYAEGNMLYNSYADILTDKSRHIASWVNAVPERIRYSLRKFNYEIHAYERLQNGEITAKDLVDGEIKRGKEIMSTIK